MHDYRSCELPESDVRPEVAFIPGGLNTPELAPAWPECRSLLAGDSAIGSVSGVPNRLQAGSYKNEERGMVGLIKCPGAFSADL